jgi:hypothetical protein
VFDPAAIIRVLVEHHVRFIVVGGVAATLNGAIVATQDLDVLYALDDENVVRVMQALDALDARFRQRPDLRPNTSHMESRGHKLLDTRHGRCDFLGHVAPDLEYDDLVADSTEVRAADGLKCLVLGLERLIEVKQAVGRPKDLAVLPLLRATLAERDRE